MKCPECGMDNPTWQHLAWEGERKRRQEREIERKIERRDRGRTAQGFPYMDGRSQ